MRSSDKSFPLPGRFAAHGQHAFFFCAARVFLDFFAPGGLPAGHALLKILHAIHSADPRGGGPIEGIKQLAAAHRGGEIAVVSLDAAGQPWMAEFPLPLYPLGPSWTSYGYSPRFIPWLRKHHAEYDVVIVNGIWQFNSLGVRAALRGTATPYCLFTHGMLDPWFKRQYPLKHLKKWLYWPWAEYRCLRDAAAVFFTAEEERRLARQSFWLYRCNEVVVNYGTAGPAGDPAAQRALFLAQFPALRDRRILLFLGRLHEKKGCDLLLDAFAQIRAKNPAARDFHLVMAGPGEGAFAARIKARAEQLGIAGQVTWPGMLSGALKWGAFHAAEVFVLPSHQENFGISVAEALACGKPVLISNKINIWREIAEDGAGLVEDDDLAGTIALLDRWTALDERGREAMAGRARSCFARRFEITQAAQSLEKALAGVIAAARSAA